MSDTNNNHRDNPKPSPSGKFLDSDTWEALKASGFSEKELHQDQPFGPVIFAYTRKQAIADGVLVDLSRPGFRRVLAMCGIAVHTAMTATAFAQVITPELTQASAWDALLRTGALLKAFRAAALQEPKTDRVHFVVEGVGGEPVHLWAHIGPGDNGEPVLTIMLEGED